MCNDRRFLKSSLDQNLETPASLTISKAIEYIDWKCNIGQKKYVDEKIKWEIFEIPGNPPRPNSQQEFPGIPSNQEFTVALQHAFGEHNCSCRLQKTVQNSIHYFSLALTSIKLNSWLFDWIMEWKRVAGIIGLRLTDSISSKRLNSRPDVIISINVWLL